MKIRVDRTVAGGLDVAGGDLTLNLSYPEIYRIRVALEMQLDSGRKLLLHAHLDFVRQQTLLTGQLALFR